MGQQRSTAVLEREGDMPIALCPQLDVVSQEVTLNEARVNPRETVELFLETAGAQEIEERSRSEVFVTQFEVARG